MIESVNIAVTQPAAAAMVVVTAQRAATPAMPASLIARTGVESVPSEPKDEGTKNLEGNIVGLESDRLFKSFAILVVVTALAGSEDDRLSGPDGMDDNNRVDKSGELDVPLTATITANSDKPRSSTSSK
jgi:hypothetical protein